jgi:hypothetical protein
MANHPLQEERVLSCTTSELFCFRKTLTCMSKFDKWTALDQLKIAKNCPASWRQMHGDDRVRHCTHCDRNVYNISDLSREEVADLLERTEGRLCVRFYLRLDGKVMTRDCGRAEKALLRVRLAVGSVVALCGTLFSLITFGAISFSRNDLSQGDASPPPEFEIRRLGKTISDLDLQIRQEKNPEFRREFTAKKERVEKELADYKARHFATE